MDNKKLEESLKIFIQEWRFYIQRLDLFCSTIQALPKNIDDYLEEVEKRTKITSEEIFSLSLKLREKIFLIGEENLWITTIYSWNRFKINFPHIEKIGYLTPFSFISDWYSIPNLMNAYNEEGLREAIFLSYDFIEYLTFKYPKLKDI